MRTVEMKYNGHILTVICPEKAADGMPWVWRAEFLGAFDYADKQLLKEGWHIVNYRLWDMYGSPEAVKLMKSAHDFVVRKFGLNPKADIFGFSRGGLYTVNYTLAHPDDIASVYLDAPVLDVFSWPSQRYDTEWRECSDIYDLDGKTSKDFEENPINNLSKLVSLRIPIILVAGDSDEVVPYEENGKYLAQECKKANAVHKVIIKPGVGHHPHSLENPAEIVEFIKKERLA